MSKHKTFEVVIKPKGRSPADEYSHKGKTWIEGRENSNYVIELTNHDHSRMMAIVSVDGVGVVDGKPASFESRGYILAPRQTISIPGWLIDGNTAAQFVFSKRADSYSQQVDQAGNQGVIGVAWFREKIKPMTSVAFTQVLDTWHAPTKGIRTFNDIAGSGMIASNGIYASSSAAPEMSLGTGFGESQTFATTSVEFEKANDLPDHVSLIYYDSAANLIRRGIKLKERHTRNDPHAFPGNQEFCAPPPGWALKSWSKK